MLADLRVAAPPPAVGRLGVARPPMARRRRRQHRKRPASWLWSLVAGMTPHRSAATAAAVVLVFAAIATAGIMLSANAAAVATATREFERDAGILTTQLRESASSAVRAMSYIAAAIAATAPVFSPRAFKSIAGRMVMDTPALRVARPGSFNTPNVVFCPLVPHDDRAVWESEVARLTGWDSNITQFVNASLGGPLRIADARPVYAPFTFFAVLQQIRPAFHFYDLFDTPSRNETATAAMRARTAVFSAPTFLIQDPTDVGVSMVAPVLIDPAVMNCSRQWLTSVGVLSSTLVSDFNAPNPNLRPSDALVLALLAAPAAPSVMMATAVKALPATLVETVLVEDIPSLDALAADVEGAAVVRSDDGSPGRFFGGYVLTGITNATDPFTLAAYQAADPTHATVLMAHPRSESATRSRIAAAQERSSRGEALVRSLQFRVGGRWYRLTAASPATYLISVRNSQVTVLAVCICAGLFLAGASWAGFFVSGRFSMQKRELTSLALRNANAQSELHRRTLAWSSHLVRNPAHRIAAHADLVAAQLPPAHPALADLDEIVRDRVPNPRHKCTLIGTVMARCYPPPPPQRSSVGDIDRMLGDVLDIQEWDSGHLSLRYRCIDVREGVRRLLVTQAPLAAVPLRWSVDASVPRFIVVDDARLRHVLSTGLWNACKASASGEVLLYVTLVQGEAAGESTTHVPPRSAPARPPSACRVWLRLEVQDHGPSVPELPTQPLDLPTSAQADLLLVGPTATPTARTLARTSITSPPGTGAAGNPLLRAAGATPAPPPPSPNASAAPSLLTSSPFAAMLRSEGHSLPPPLSSLRATVHSRLSLADWGLGLRTAASMAVVMGGRLQLYRDVARGVTIYRCDLPLYPPELAALEGAAHRLAASDPAIVAEARAAADSLAAAPGGSAALEPMPAGVETTTTLAPAASMVAVSYQSSMASPWQSAARALAPAAGTIDRRTGESPPHVTWHRPAVAIPPPVAEVGSRPSSTPPSLEGRPPGDVTHSAPGQTSDSASFALVVTPIAVSIVRSGGSDAAPASAPASALARSLSPRFSRSAFTRAGTRSRLGGDGGDGGDTARADEIAALGALLGQPVTDFVRRAAADASSSASASASGEATGQSDDDPDSSSSDSASDHRGAVVVWETLEGVRIADMCVASAAACGEVEPGRRAQPQGIASGTVPPLAAAACRAPASLPGTPRPASAADTEVRQSPGCTSATAATAATRPIAPAQLIGPDIPELASLSEASPVMGGSGAGAGARAAGKVPLPHLGLRVLHADDEATNTRLMTRMLAMLGCEAVCVGDGDEVYERLRQTGQLPSAAPGVAAGAAAAAERPFDAVALDIVMRRQCGDETCRELRHVHGLTTLPIIACTANAHDKAGLRAAGFDMVLPKPFNAAQLAEALAAVVAQRGGGGAAAPARDAEAHLTADEA